MSRLMCRGFWPLLCAGGFLLAAGGPALGQAPDQRLEKIFADWKKRQARTKSVRYQVSGNRVIAKGSFLDDDGRRTKIMPPRDVTAVIQRTLIFDFVTGRYRWEIEDQDYDTDADKFHPKAETRVFDGKQIKMLRPRERNTHPMMGVRPGEPELGIATGYFGLAPVEVEFWPLFVGHGYVPTWDRGPTPGKFKVLPDKDMSYIHGQAVHEGRSCWVVRTRPQGSCENFDEYWVDAAVESAVVRQASFCLGKMQFEAAIAYQKTAHGWLPRRWTFTERNFNDGTLIQVQRMDVRELSLDPPVGESSFAIDERPGMRVEEAVLKAPEPDNMETVLKTTQFVVGEDGRRHKIVEGGAGFWRSLLWWVGAPVALAMVIFVWLIRRRRAIPSSGR